MKISMIFMTDTAKGQVCIRLIGVALTASEDGVIGNGKGGGMESPYLWG
jgi:hypothetical protein